MKRWSGGTLIATLAFVLLLRYGFHERTPTSSATTSITSITTASTTTTSTSVSSRPPLSWINRKKPHLIPDLEGLADLYSPAATNFSDGVLRSTLVWTRMRGLLSRSDALADTRNGVKEAAVAWRELMLAAAAEDEVSGNGTEHRRCPFSVVATKDADNGDWTMVIPCGLVQDSAVTIVGVPGGGSRSSGFDIELIGSEVQGEGDVPPVVLRYHVSPGGGEADIDGAFISQRAWTTKHGWGEEERCPSHHYRSGVTVDGLVHCNEQTSKITAKEKTSGTQTGNDERQKIYLGTTQLSVNFPFVKEQPFTATLWNGVEGFHMTVNGKHETSFSYKERLEPWLISGVKVRGDLELLSFLANGLPITEDLEMISNIESLRAPPVHKKRIFLLIGVFSTANNFERRMALRRTWMQYGAVRSGDVAVRFFTGLHKSSQANIDLLKEARAYEDMQLMPFVDYYSLISLKTIGICIFGVMQTKLLPAKYLMKTDDDAFVRIDEVISTLKKSSSNGLLYGLISFDSEPHRDKDSKWYISPEEWPNISYPPWAHGPGYIISRDIARFIVQGHQERNLQLFKLEDVAMGIWIREFQNSGQEVHYSNDDRFHSSNCEDGYVLAHYQGPRLILCLWEKLQTENKPICCE